MREGSEVMERVDRLTGGLTCHFGGKEVELGSNICEHGGEKIICWLLKIIQNYPKIIQNFEIP